MFNIKNQAECIRKFTIEKYGVGSDVPKGKLISEVKSILDVDYARAEVLVLLLIGINYLSELRGNIQITERSLESIDSSKHNRSIFN